MVLLLIYSNSLILFKHISTIKRPKLLVKYENMKFIDYSLKFTEKI